MGRGMTSTRIAVVTACAEMGIHVQLAKPFRRNVGRVPNHGRHRAPAQDFVERQPGSRTAPSFYAVTKLIRAGVFGELISGHIAWDARGDCNIDRTLTGYTT